eukprot:1692622-Rhodomonas_salina.1
MHLGSVVPIRVQQELEHCKTACARHVCECSSPSLAVEPLPIPISAWLVVEQLPALACRRVKHATVTSSCVDTFELVLAIDPPIVRQRKPLSACARQHPRVASALSGSSVRAYFTIIPVAVLVVGARIERLAVVHPAKLPCLRSWRRTQNPLQEISEWLFITANVQEQAILPHSRAILPSPTIIWFAFRPGHGHGGRAIRPLPDALPLAITGSDPEKTARCEATRLEDRGGDPCVGEGVERCKYHVPPLALLLCFGPG